MQDPVPTPSTSSLHASPPQNGWLDAPTETMAAPLFDGMVAPSDADSPWAPTIPSSPSVPIFCWAMADEVQSSLAPPPSSATHVFPFEEELVVSGSVEKNPDEVFSSCTVAMVSLSSTIALPSLEGSRECGSPSTMATGVRLTTDDAGATTEASALSSPLRPTHRWYAVFTFAALAFAMLAYISMVTSMLEK